MTHLPAYDPADVATKTDLNEFRREMGEEMASRFDALDERMNRVLLTLTAGLFVIVASVIGLIGVVVAAL